MAKQQPARRKAEDLLLHHPMTVPVMVRPSDPQPSDWLAQPYFGAVLETYTTDNMDTLGPPGATGRKRAPNA